MADQPKAQELPEGAIVFDGSAKSLARAIELILGNPIYHDFGCRPSNGHCTSACVHRKNIREIAEVALLEYRRKVEQENEHMLEGPAPYNVQWRH